MEMPGAPPPGGLIVTSLRLPFVIKRKCGEEGGEGGEGEVVREESRDEWARSVAHLVRESGGQWVGWAGSALSEADLEQVGQQFSPVSLSLEEVEAQYGHCREALWPLLHSMADRAVFSESHWAQYSRVNTIFAEATLAALRQSSPLSLVVQQCSFLIGRDHQSVAINSNFACSSLVLYGIRLLAKATL